MADTRPIGFWLKVVDKLIDERFAEILEEHGVTRRQWQLLNVIQRGPATVQELDAATAPFTDGASADSSADLGELVESQWLVISGSGYQLTERGQLAVTRLSEVVDELRESTSEGLSQQEYDTTVASLERMAINLGYTEPDSPAQG